MSLYGLHQAPRAWYERLSTFLLKHGYRRGAIDKTLFIKNDRRDIMLVQVYVDDIIFGSTKPSMVKDFEELMQKEFMMNSMGELTFFLGLQVKQTTTGNLSEEHHDQDDHNHTTFVYEDFDATNVVTSDLERKSDETEQVIIEEEKDTSDVKSRDTEELDLERIQSTARQSVVTPRTVQR
ncbi:putative ribonuclease H-like domain-containing protein [Tanacetum coccineum]